jgi:hypothetical protein
MMPVFSLNIFHPFQALHARHFPNFFLVAAGILLQGVLDMIAFIKLQPSIGVPYPQSGHKKLFT